MLLPASHAAATNADTSGRRALLRLARIALVAHVALSTFSAFAFATFLAPPYPAWLATPENSKALVFGMQWGGQSTVVLGAIAGFSFLAWAIGTQRAFFVFAISFALSLTSELAGTSTGFPFGAYSYTQQLGYRIGGLVPFNIPTSWFYMLVASLAICARVMPSVNTNKGKWWWAFIAALVLTAWDVSMDPAMVKTTHWLWHVRDLSATSALSRFVGTPFFYGMPLTNWLGWVLTGTLVARAMLAMVPPTEWAERVGPHKFPLLLYGANALLPIAICFRRDMMLAGVFGTLAMGIPLFAAWKSGRLARP